MKRLLPIVLLAGPMFVLPGCIAWEIRDEIRTTNQHLCEVSPALVHTLHGMEETNREIVKTQAQLSQVQTALAQTQAQLDALHATLRQTDANVVAVGGTLGQTNPKLGDMQSELVRMRILSDVHAKLTDVDRALGPLSSAMGSLGGAMSWLGGGDSGDELLDEKTAAAPGPVDASAVAGAEPDAAEGSPGGAARSGEEAKRADPLLGTWVLVYPPPASMPVGAGAAGVGGAAGTPQSTAATAITMGRISIIMANGNLLFAEAGKPIRKGTWMRQGRKLTYTLEPVTAGGQPEVLTGELLTLNSRTLTVRRGDVITVHARP